MSRRGARTVRWLVLILVLAAALRVGYALERRHAPDFTEPLADAAFHDYWARGLATGEWAPPAGEPDPRIGEVPFLRPPGYPYFLAGVYRAFGAGPGAAMLTQMVLGGLQIVLLARLGRALLGEPGGTIVAALAALSWTALYFEGELQAPVLVQAGALLALGALLLAARRRSLAWAVAGGLLLGGTAVVRANTLLFAPVAAAWVFLVLRREAGVGRSTGCAAAMLIGVVLAVAPVTWRNAQVSGGEFVPISLNGGINLHIGNHDEADGESAAVRGLEKLTGKSGWSWFRYGDMVDGFSRRVGAELTHAEVSDSFARMGWTWIRENPGRFLQLSARRATLFWGPREISNNKAIALEKENSRVLRWLPPFPFFLGLSLVGVVLLFRARPRGGEASPDRAGLALVAAFVLTMFLSYVPFLAAARFRAPLIPCLLLFGAYAVARAAAAVRAGRWTPVLAGAAAVIVLSVGLTRAAGESPVDRAWWHTDRAVALVRQERRDEAEVEFRAALKANPGYVDAHHRLGDLLRDEGDPQGALEHYQAVVQQRPDRTDLMMKAAVLFLDLQQWGRAEGILEQVERIVPDSPDAPFERGRALIELGRPAEALESLDRTLALSPDHARAWTNKGIALARLDRHEEAIQAYEQATELAPFLAEAFHQLGRSLEALARPGEAELAHDQARRLRATYLEPRVHLGNLANARGDFAKAIEWYEEARRIDPDHVTTLYNLSGALANAGRLDEAADALEHALEVSPAHELSRQRLEQIRALRR